MRALSTFTRGRGRPKSQSAEKSRKQDTSREPGDDAPLKKAPSRQTICYGIFLCNHGIITAAERDAAFHYKRMTERYIGTLRAPGFSRSHYGERVQTSAPWTPEETTNEKLISDHYRSLSSCLKKNIKPYTLKSFERWARADIPPDDPFKIGTQMQFKEVCQVILEYLEIPGGH